MGVGWYEKQLEDEVAEELLDPSERKIKNKKKSQITRPEKMLP